MTPIANNHDVLHHITLNEPYVTTRAIMAGWWASNYPGNRPNP